MRWHDFGFGLWVGFLLCGAFVAALLAFSADTDPERATWFADCLERGNDPTWCRESEGR
jgi:hypothetical protein